MYTDFRVGHNVSAFQHRPVCYFATSKPHYTGIKFHCCSQLVGWTFYAGAMYKIRKSIMRILGLNNGFLSMRSYIDYYDVLFPYSLDLTHTGGYKLKVTTPKLCGETKSIYTKIVKECNVREVKLTCFETRDIERAMMKFIKFSNKLIKEYDLEEANNE